jgi:hypothetical protein
MRVELSEGGDVRVDEAKLDLQATCWIFEGGEFARR